MAIDYGIGVASEFSARLTAARSGDPAALSRAFDDAYDQLHRLARTSICSSRRAFPMLKFKEPGSQ